ncbi:MAG: prolipoprotein diacylglyceryl transferase [Ignavibacteriaceae bacterium]|nr:prolipoprotein diacylglyceryl transferase [Ignavibacteriaceae bacterium]
MYPEIVKIGPLTVYSYGLMLGIAFLVASYILTKEFERKGLDKNAATEITLFAIIFGVIGSKLFHLFENWSDFLADPVTMAFSPGGLTFYGGLLLAMFSILIYLRRKKINFFYAADGTAPSLAIAYGIGRIGCHLAGDGDYGIPTSLPWGTNYENGVVPPSVMFRDSEIAAGFPNGIVPDNTPLHPTPIYEFLVGLAIFYFLWSLRKKNKPVGYIFMLYFILSGIARFLVEFIRLNPDVLFGMSSAQLISMGLIIAGIIGLYMISRNPAIFGVYPSKAHEVKPKKSP